MYQATSNIKHKAMILTLYSTGMWVSELIHLKVVNIDSERMLIHIEEAKNRKNRYVPLSEKLLEILRRYWIAKKPKSWTWVFPGRGGNAPLARTSVAKMIQNVRMRAGISKPVTTHTMSSPASLHKVVEYPFYFTVVAKIWTVTPEMEIHKSLCYSVSAHVVLIYQNKWSNHLNRLQIRNN